MMQIVEILRHGGGGGRVYVTVNTMAADDLVTQKKTEQCPKFMPFPRSEVSNFSWCQQI